MSVEDNAHKLVGFAASVASGARQELCRDHPQLRTAARIEHWDFFVTALLIWTAYSRIGLDVEESKRATVESIVMRGVEDWNRQGTPAMEDLTQFVLKMSQDETDIDRKRSLTPLLGGMWVVWNLMEKQPSESEAGLVSAIGELFVAKFGAFWRVEM